MYAISKKNLWCIASLFEGWNETPVWSCLQGHLGQAFADDPDNPQSAQISIGDFCFLPVYPIQNSLETFPIPAKFLLLL